MISDATYMYGWVECTPKNGYGCICHTELATPSVSVWIDGPREIRLGTSTLYRINIASTPAVAAGYNVAAGHGILAPADTFSKLLYGELTHSFPKDFGSDTIVSWEFYFRGTSIGYDTLFSAANGVNKDETELGDYWNFGNNFIVLVTDTANSVNEELFLTTFWLEQNYPNPFNSSTTIRFEAPKESMVTLKVYNLIGQEVATLVDESSTTGGLASIIQTTGLRTIEWNASQLPSGVYFYKLQAGKNTLTKKMSLLR